MPSAPNETALAASSGVSALVLIPSLRNLSARAMNFTKRGFSEASIVSIFALYTRPLAPLRLNQSPSLNSVSVPAKVTFLPARSIFIASQPTMQHLPHPRATRAACEVMPPRTVRIPDAALMPSMSSGEVSSRTRITLRPSAAAATASSGVNTRVPTAPPGDAGRPCAIAVHFFSDAESRIGWRISSSCAGETLITAVFSSIMPSASMSVAIWRAARPVLLPIRHWSIQSLPS